MGRILPSGGEISTIGTFTSGWGQDCWHATAGSCSNQQNHILLPRYAAKLSGVKACAASGINPQNRHVMQFNWGFTPFFPVVAASAVLGRLLKIFTPYIKRLQERGDGIISCLLDQLKCPHCTPCAPAPISAGETFTG